MNYVCLQYNYDTAKCYYPLHITLTVNWSKILISIEFYRLVFTLLHNCL